ncbi:unnamed protein product, partial [Cladocopium goreaui]
IQAMPSSSTKPWKNLGIEVDAQLWNLAMCFLGASGAATWAFSDRICLFPDIWLTICCFFEAVASLVHLQKEHLRRWCSPRWRRSAGDPSVGFCRVWRRMLNHPRLADGHPEADAS